MKQLVILVTCAVALALATTTAQAATAQATQVMRNWKTMDNCAQKAQAAFPDFSAESNAKRDAALKNCLNAGHLPPRAPESGPGQ
jgi:hypothetical protein